MKRIACFVILLSMMLHCADRLGVLSYLYKQRHNVALAAGLIAEVPIALCSSDYHTDDLITFADMGEGDEVPPTVHSSEIILFSYETGHDFSLSLFLLRDTLNGVAVDERYSQPILNVFHPPC